MDVCLDKWSVDLEKWCMRSEWQINLACVKSHTLFSLSPMYSTLTQTLPFKIHKIPQVSQRKSGLHISRSSALPVQNILSLQLKLRAYTIFNFHVISYKTNAAAGGSRKTSQSQRLLYLTASDWQFCTEIQKMLGFHTIKSKTNMDFQIKECFYIKTRQNCFSPPFPQKTRLSLKWGSA